MSSLSVCLGLVAPYYNLALVIVVIGLFVRLFKSKNKEINKPWKFLFAALLIYVVEEVLTVLRAASIVKVPRYVNGFFEMGMVSLFIYMLLKQKQTLKKMKK